MARRYRGDIIDSLDHSSSARLHHDGPYDAARMQYAKEAAMKADAAGSSNHPRPSSKLSARAQHTLNAMSASYPPAQASGSGASGSATASVNSSRRTSTSSISVLGGTVDLGYPVHGGKADALTEAFGIVNTEAWADFGNRRYSSAPRDDDADDDSLNESSGLSREERNIRAQSIWDMEATLQAGKPVGASISSKKSSSLPPVPALPAEYAQSNNVAAPESPKRSKSLMQRFRAREGRQRRAQSQGGSASSSPMNDVSNNNANSVSTSKESSNSSTKKESDRNSTSESSKPSRPRSAKKSSSSVRPTISHPSLPIEAGIFSTDSNGNPITVNNKETLATSAPESHSYRRPHHQIPKPQQLNYPTLEELGKSKLSVSSNDVTAPKEKTRRSNSAGGLGRKTSIMDRFREGFARKEKAAV